MAHDHLIRSLLVALFGALVAGCSAGGTVKANVGSVPGAQGSRLEYLWAEPAGSASYPLILYLDGSGCRSVTNVLSFTQPFLARGFGTVLPEKRGVRVDDDGTRCSEAFLQTNDRAQRVADAVSVLGQARLYLPRWDGRLIVAGALEGGAIAPEVALAYPSTVAVISLAGGGWSQAVELRYLEVRKGPMSDVAALEKRFDEIRSSAVTERTWLGSANTYKRWASYLDFAPIEPLARLTVPIFVAHGVRDGAVPIASADAIASRFATEGKSNLTYRRYESLDHQWSDSKGLPHVREVVSDVMTWLVANVGANR